MVLIVIICAKTKCNGNFTLFRLMMMVDDENHLSSYKGGPIFLLQREENHLTLLVFSTLTSNFTELSNVP